MSILTEFRVWPPGDRDWRYWLTWLSWYPATGSFFLVGVLDWGSLDVVPLSGRIAGAVVTLIGLGITFEAILELGVSVTNGLEGQLQTGGLYQYSRNPRYVGDILLTAGWAMVTDSLLTLVVGIAFVVYHLLLPFAGEGWLRQQSGAVYERYRSEGPPFWAYRQEKLDSLGHPPDIMW